LGSTMTVRRERSDFPALATLVHRLRVLNILKVLPV
jgi:hypothetical protein